MTMQPHRLEVATAFSLRAASRFGDATAIVASQLTMTYSRLRECVEKVSLALTAFGVGEGSIVAVRSDNSLEFVLAITSLMEVGANAAPLPDRYPDAALVEMCRTLGAQKIISSGQGRSSAFSDAGFEVRSLDEFIPPLTAGPVSHFKPASEAPPQLDPDRLALSIFTSGSLGAPRAAALTYKNLICSALGSNANIPLGPGDRWLLCLPLYHVGGVGILMRCFLSGAAVVLPPDARQIAESIDRFGVTHVSLVPTQLRRLVHAGPAGGSWSTLKAVLVGGGPTDPDLARTAHQAGIPVRLTYGLTEMASQVTTTGASGRGDPGASGRVLPFRSVRISNAGEILVRGETLFRGYLVDGRARTATDGEGWFHTGDRGHFDRECNLIVTGRLDDMFVSGGENVFPAEIERLIDNIAGIDRSIVVGVNDHEFGSRPVAFVKYSGEPLPEAEVLTSLISVLPSYKRPVAVFELPESAERSLAKYSRQQLAGIAYKLLQEKGFSPPAQNR